MPLRLLLLMLALALGVRVAAAPPVARAETDGVDAVLLVAREDLARLLASGYFRAHTLLAPADVGLEITPQGIAPRAPDALLTPTDLGPETARPWVPFVGLAPHLRGFVVLGGRPVPVFVFPPPLVAVPPPAPVFARVAIVPLPPALLPPPPAPLAAPPPPLPPPARAAVPIIPEADSLALLTLGLGGLAGLVGVRRWRR
ncbi:MAG TPA: hypothetical protein VKZ60_04785 [Chloroflexota bacterium]|jgi:hypothetical protein|nr:hypothetical protein [Chloroflexota bacterium]